MSLSLKIKNYEEQGIHINSILENNSKNSLSQAALWQSWKKFSNTRTAKSTGLDELDDAKAKQRISSDRPY